MKCTIECSYGEIIDKITILKIKLEKVKNEDQRKNISKEYESLKKWIKQNDTTFDKYFNELYTTNKKLWGLEDNIRDKSKKNIYDTEYIEYAEQIHITNDHRYLIKSKLNNTYNSDLKEEKIYDNNRTKTSKQENKQENKDMNPFDIKLFENAINNHIKGEFVTALNTIENLCEKYINATPSETVINLYFCMDTASTIFGKTNKYEYKIHEFIHLIDSTIIANEKMSVHLKQQYGQLLLKNKNYTSNTKNYAKYINTVVADGPNLNIHYENMSYFKKDDKNKTLLIYPSGGFGDKIMYCRFIRKVCETNQENNNYVIFLIDDSLYWIYSFIYSDIKNIKLIKHSQRYLVTPHDYHINITMLMYYLDITYETMYTDYYLTCLPESQICLDDIIDPTKKNIVINWHGNYENSCEKYNRGMNLSSMIPLFENESLSNINWISVQKEVNKEEIDILKKYNVKNLYNVIDNDGDAFKDTLTILKKVDLVISTDTSLTHIAATANVKCWALLTTGCDWRWITDNINICTWYPKIKLIKQKSIGQWGSVITKVVKALIIIETKNTTNTNINNIDRTETDDNIIINI
jgi:hypothetical protein